MLLERNGKASSGKRTWHINICCFFITDRVNMKEVEIKWCLMGMTSIKRSKNPTLSSVKLKKRKKKAERLVSPS